MAACRHTWGCKKMDAVIGCLVLLLLCVPETEAQFAKSSYYTDTASDCYISGFLLMRTDNVVNINSRNPKGVGASDVLQCSIKFRPENENDIMDMSFSYFSMADKDVTLRVEVSGAGSYTLTSASRQPDRLTAKGGMATVTLTRLSLNDKDYSFGIILRVYREDDSQVATDESPVAVGLVAGIVGGVIGFLILLAIFIVCCWRRKKEQYNRARAGPERKADMINDNMSTSHSYGYDNAAQNGTMPRWDKGKEDEYYDDSPHSRKKLLYSQNNRMANYRDQNESDSDTKDKDPYIIRQYDRSPAKTAKLNYENESSRRTAQQQENVQMRREQQDPRNGNARPPASNQNQNPPPKSPLLSALHSNPKFRASFHANEADAEDRLRRISGGDVDGNESDASMTETWNTTFDTQFDDLDDRPAPRPAQRHVPKPPPLPPVPKSPKSPLRRENTASIRRAPRPSSSSSEIEQLQNAEADAGIRMVQNGDDPPSPSEIVPIRVNDPHSPTTKRKADTQHTLRPDRKTKGTKAKPAKSVDVPTDEETTVKSKAAAGSKKPKQTKTDAIPEYEGRFKKAPSGRKTKSKSPRLGRSRSTGDYLDEQGSTGRARSSSYNRVPIVTADDYEDSDVESNYNPLRRSGSKNSLYASRSSLYGRRRSRKNSFGESVASFAQDDMDYYRPSRGSFTDRSLSRHDRVYKSLGDLEQELRDQATRSTQTLRECATQTGAGYANATHGKKIVVKRGKPRSVSSSTTQTIKRAKDHDTSSSSSGTSKPRERKNSASSTSGLHKSRERKNSTSSNSGKPKRTKSESGERSKRAKDSDGRPETPRQKPKPAPKPKPRKSTAASVSNLSDDEGPIDQSSMISGSVQPGVALNPAVLGQPIYPPQGIPPGYPVGYPPQMAYMQATGQPPMMMPYGPHPGVVPVHTGAVAQNPGAPTPVAAPVIAPKPASKWDMLCKMTGGETGDSLETASMAGSVLSQGPSAHHIPPTYSSAVSDYYAGSEYSAPRSYRAPSQASGTGGMQRKSSWSALKEMADREYASRGSEYAPSESNV